MLYTIGIDPDVNGYFVILKEGKVLDYDKLSADGKYIDFWLLFEKVNTKLQKVKSKPFVYIEKPFTPGRYGGVETTWRNYQKACDAFSRLHITEIRPTDWQKGIGISIPKDTPKKERRKALKQASFNFAKREFSKIDFNRYSIKTGKVLTGREQGLADALCIAYYGFLQNLK